nr:hypothetical protein [Tanacetum cinerariifolium]
MSASCKVARKRKRKPDTMIYSESVTKFFFVLFHSPNTQLESYFTSLVSVRVSDVNIIDMASILGCGVVKIPMVYLGVPVGCNMNRIDNWKCIVQKFASKLSQWKARLLSVGGRVFLIKSVLCNLPTYYLSLYKMPTFVLKKLESMRNKFFIGGDLDDKKVTWVKWNVCLASKATGGLGIGSIYALNMSLLIKWIWRFRSNSSDLWVKVIRSIHRHDGGIKNKRSSAAFLSPWKVIVNSVYQLQRKGVNLFDACSRSLGNGMNIRFWDEKWCGDMLLKDCFPRVFALEGDKNCNVADPPNGFSVASARKHIDVHILPCGLSTTRWNGEIPRGCSWSKNFPFQNWDNYGQLFPEAKKPNCDLYPNKCEAQSEWFKRSTDFLKMYTPRAPPVKYGANKDPINELVDALDDLVDESYNFTHNGVVEVEKDLSEDDGLKVQKLEAENKLLAEQRRIRFHKMKEQENDMKSSYFSNSTHMKLALEKCRTNKRKYDNVLSHR